MSIKGCNKCNLKDKCTVNKIDGSFPLDENDILIVLDMPDKFEARNHKILDSDIKSKISYFLSKAGIDKTKIGFTHAIKCDTSKVSDIKLKHIKSCRDHLFYDIAQFNPRLIIAMGNIANWALTDNNGIRDFRGHFNKFELTVSDQGKKISVPIMPTFSPYASQFKWEYNDIIIADLKKANEYLTDPDVIKLDTLPKDIFSVRTRDEMDYMVSTLTDESSPTKFIVNDLETTGFKHNKHHIINAGYCTDDDKIFIVPLLEYQKEHAKKWDMGNIAFAKKINTAVKENRDYFVKGLKHIHEHKGNKFIYHNGKFDIKFLQVLLQNNRLANNWFYDTMFASPLIDENKGHSLNVVMERFGINFGPYDTKLWPYTNKDEKKKKSYQFVPPILLEEYLAIDVYGCKQIVVPQMKLLKEQDLYDYFMKIKMPCAKIVNNMEFKGVKFDREKIIEGGRSIYTRYNEIQEMAKKITKNENFNISSSKQLLEYMDEAGYPFERFKVKKNKTGYSTDKETMKLFAKYKKWAVIPQLVLEFKALSKLVGTYTVGKDYYTEKKIEGGFLAHLDEKDRVRTSYNIHSTKTGRYGSKEPSLMVFPRPIKGLPNVRNFVRSTNDDYCIISADYAQLEICLSGLLFKDKVLLDRIRKGVDIHCLNTVTMGKKLGTVKKHVTYEYIMTAIGKGDKVGNVIDIKTIPDEEIQELNKKRTQTKNIGFGLLYGKEARTFAEEFGIGIEDAERMIEAYLDEYKATRKGREELKRQAVANGHVEFLYGRKRRFYPLADWLADKRSKGNWFSRITREEILRQALNAPIQGSAHEVYERALIRCMSEIQKRKMRARPILLIHDDITFDCPNEEKSELIEIIQKTLPYTFNAGTDLELTLKVDVDCYNTNWYMK